MKKKLLYVFAILALTHCSKSNNSKDLSNIARIDITNASQLMLAKSTTADVLTNQLSGSGSLTNTFNNNSKNETLLKFNITNNRWESATYTNESGEKINNSVAPDTIINVNEEFVMLIFFENFESVNSEQTFLARKSDGALFKVSSNRLNYSPVNRFSRSPNRIQPIVFTNNGDLHYPSVDENGIVKPFRINTSADPITIEQAFPLPQNTSIQDLAVLSDGSFIYLDGNTSGVKIYAPVQNKTTALQQNGFYWLDDQSIMRIHDSVDTFIVTIDQNGDPVLISDSVNWPSSMGSLAPNNALYEVAGHKYTHIEGQYPLTDIIELSGSTMSPRSITLPSAIGSTNFDAELQLIYNDTRLYYFDSEENIIRMLIPGNNSFNDLVDSNDLEINALFKNINGKVYFEAFRLSDSSQIVAEIKDNDTYEIIDELPFNPNPRVLIQIN